MKSYKLLLALGYLTFSGFACSPADQSYQSIPQHHIIEIRQMAFVPETLRVEPGDSVQWVNRDIVTHNVAEKASKQWRSENLEPSDTFTLKVQDNHSYICSLHPVMQGVILIER